MNNFCLHLVSLLSKSTSVRGLGRRCGMRCKIPGSIVISTLTARRSKERIPLARSSTRAVSSFDPALRARTTGSASAGHSSAKLEPNGLTAWVLRARARRWSRRPSADSLAHRRMGDSDPCEPNTILPGCIRIGQLERLGEARLPWGSCLLALQPEHTASPFEALRIHRI